MAAVWARGRAELRARWRAWLGLSLAVGVAAGAVLALAAGARRTASAYPRLVAAERPADLECTASKFGRRVGPGPVSLDKLPRLPGWPSPAGSSCSPPTGRHRIRDTDTTSDQRPSRPGRVGLARRKLVSGRQADPARADEAVVGFTVAEQYRSRVGANFASELIVRAGSA